MDEYFIQGLEGYGEVFEEFGFVVEVGVLENSLVQVTFFLKLAELLDGGGAVGFT